MDRDVFIYCPRCAHRLETGPRFGRERQYCPNCGYIRFRDPKLAVGALIIEAGCILLIRRAVIPRIGYWAVPSGFVEYDEQPRAALAREVKEETGLEVNVGRVVDIFPLADPQKQGVFLLFQAQVRGGDLAHGDDVSEVRWFSLDEIPWGELAFDGLRSVLQTMTRRQEDPGADDDD